MRRANLSVLAAILALSWPAAIRAEFTFDFNEDNTLTITGLEGEVPANLVIPPTVYGWNVTRIGNRAFAASAVTSVSLPEGITHIGADAFWECGSLTQLTLPNSVVSLGDRAFIGCGSLRALDLGTGVTNLGKFCFSRTGLLNFTIPTNVIHLGGGCFASSGLTNLAVAAGNPSYVSTNGMLYTKDLSELVVCPINIIAPPFFGGLGGTYYFSSNLTSIGDGVFQNCWFYSTMTIPNGVTNIGDWVFDGCNNLETVVLPPSLVHIGTNAFNNCQALTTIALPAGLTSIGANTFRDCGYLADVTIPASVTTIGSMAFGNCTGLKSFTIPKGVTTIGDYAFYDCSGLTNVQIAASVTNLDESAFGYCPNLRQVYFQGDAPTAPNAVFPESLCTIYYQPGTTGWTGTYSGRPTAWWYRPQPQILGGSHGPGVRGNAFQFTVSWGTNASVAVDRSSDLRTWTPVVTNALVSGTNAFSDPDWSGQAQRFYRARLP